LAEPGCLPNCPIFGRKIILILSRAVANVSIHRMAGTNLSSYKRGGVTTHFGEEE
jgi:hypothetical protein